jgi:nucleotide-binding universal stress UspA family protein
MISQILVATDDSRIAKKAIRYAIDLAGQLKASIVLLGVIDDRDLIRQSTPIDFSHSQIMTPVRDYLKASTEKYLEKSQNLCKKNRITCRSVTRIGSPVDEIIKEAKKSKVDVIVMGSHGRGTIASAVLGSVTYGVIHKNTKYPVLVIR